MGTGRPRGSRASQVTLVARSLRFWITGGGTREPLDAVRWIGNISTGRMAAQLARAAAARGHRVTLFLAEHATAPRSSRIRIVRFVTTAELAAALNRARPAPDAIVHAAAVSDYAPIPRQGKQRSGAARWRVDLKPVKKIAPVLRRRHPRAVLCLFKLESRIGLAELLARAVGAACGANADWVFANLLEHVGREHRGWLVDPVDRTASAIVGRSAAARRIVRACEDRVAMRTVAHRRSGR